MAVAVGISGDSCRCEVRATTKRLQSSRAAVAVAVVVRTDMVVVVAVVALCRK